MFQAGKIMSSFFFFDVTSYPTFCNKHAFAKTIYVKIGRIIAFEVKMSENKFQTSSAIFDEDMTSRMTRVIFF